VWSVVRDGLGESEEGIKDISPLNSTHPSKSDILLYLSFSSFYFNF
jgi:hypothetical protein